jgi:cytochrome c peroxidase
MSRPVIIAALAVAATRLAASSVFAVAASLIASTLGTTAASARWTHASPQASARWTAEERATLRSLSLASLEPLGPDLSNRHADDPRAAALGHELFFDARLSATGKVSCATCHDPSREFQDGKPLGKGVGTTGRRTMSVASTAHSAWMFWDGRSDSQWSQALGPLESAVEHGGSRSQYAHVVAKHYRDEYEAVFGPLPSLEKLPLHAGPVPDSSSNAAWRRIPAARQEEISRVYANIGKAIAAYERRIEYAPSRFDRYVGAELAGAPRSVESTLSADELSGLRLFIGKGNCVTCHNGALLSDGHFHNTGVPASRLVSTPDSGRAVGARRAVAGEFSCTSRYSDAKPEACDELRFAVAEGPELVRAYKTPSLRNVANRAPYMHAGQLATLEEVVAHYVNAPRAPFGRSELKPLRLSATEQRELVAFLRTLSGPLAAPAGFLRPPAPR